MARNKQKGNRAALYTSEMVGQSGERPQLEELMRTGPTTR